ncbi:MAG: transcriptional repressor NrdR [Selenomonadaceae bacterium]|nr:transcriptional repressor NrdR [Selenomonadaceae bacterium]MBR3623402.1 transcriptional repressor NrdR [Selenomonadaceae bacterium]MBR3723146.1 transcriptional repressor NrdR [Selenomonadaceae bacterium]
MRCPFCKAPDSRVVDSRAAEEGSTIRRRRECGACGRRFTTYESLERVPLMVIKNDGRRETFDRNKLLNGLIRSCDKRDIEADRIVALASEIEREIRNTMEREIMARAIGERVMEHLKDFDEVAYIRFASVYRKFKDISGFQNELELLKNRDKK